jgi:peptidyl-prolyl cis-trans isomerase SurA
MEVGGVSKPFSFTDPRNETFFRILQLQSRTQPHVASLATDYSKIQSAAIEQKKTAHLSQWTSQKVDATFIRIDPQFKSCPNLRKWLPDLMNP